MADLSDWMRYPGDTKGIIQMNILLITVYAGVFGGLIGGMIYLMHENLT